MTPKAPTNHSFPFPSLIDMESTLDKKSEGSSPGPGPAANKLFDSGPQYFSFYMRNLGQFMFGVLSNSTRSSTRTNDLPPQKKKESLAAKLPLLSYIPSLGSGV